MKLTYYKLQPVFTCKHEFKTLFRNFTKETYCIRAEMNLSLASIKHTKLLRDALPTLT